MSRADKKRRRECNGLRRPPADLRIVRAAIRAGICPCKTTVDNPGEHLASCSWSDPDHGDLPW